LNRSGKITICLLSGLALTAGVRADDVVLPDDPYAIVVARNIFGLNPPPPPNANPQDATKNHAQRDHDHLGRLAGAFQSGRDAQREVHRRLMSRTS
jgi:hypothetical protein